MSTKPPQLPLKGRGLFCRGCRYSLAGLVSPGACPECGELFDFDDRRTFALSEKPPRQVGMWILLSTCIALLLIVTIGGRIAIVWGRDHPVGYVPQIWVFFAYPIWQSAIALLTVVIGRQLAWLHDIKTSVAVGAAAGVLTGVFDHVALGFLGMAMGAGAGFFVEWAWPR